MRKVLLVVIVVAAAGCDDGPVAPNRLKDGQLAAVVSPSTGDEVILQGRVISNRFDQCRPEDGEQCAGEQLVYAALVPVTAVGQCENGPVLGPLSLLPTNGRDRRIHVVYPLSWAGNRRCRITLAGDDGSVVAVGGEFSVRHGDEP